jgi:NB-ARC domain/Domain of unknown function (DUF4062)
LRVRRWRSVWGMAGPRRVFLSHTSELREFPAGRSFAAAAEAAVSWAGDAIIDMTYFTARDSRPAEYCRDTVRGCDIYVGLIGLRYGSRVRDQPERSYCELEFQAATDAGLPRLVFLLDEDAAVPIPPGQLLDRDPELHERQRVFRARLRECGVTTGKFASPERLELLLSRALWESGQPAASALVARRVPTDNTRPLPEHFEPRKDLFEAARDALLERGDGAARRVGLAGMGGAGKSVLACALARDPRVRRTFRDGIRWVYLGPQANPHDRLIELADAFGDNRPAVDSQHRLENLNEHLAELSCMVILDDVWNDEQLRQFELRGSKSALLITTRDQNILDRFVRIQKVTTLTAEPARRLLAAWAGQDPASLPAEAREVERHCDGLPLALAIAGGMVADGFGWDHLRDRLREAELSKLEFVLPGYHEHPNLQRVLDASVNCLPDDERDRYLELAVFEDRGQVPDDVAIRLWDKAKFSLRDSERLIHRLSRRSLVQRSEPRSFTLHSLQFGYARHRVGEEGMRALHARLADTILNGWGGFAEDLPGLRTSRLAEPAERYGVLNLAAHLGAAGRDRDIHHLLALGRPTAAVTGQHPRQMENTWYAVHERIGEITAYSADVRLAWNVAKAAADRAFAAAEPASAIGLEIRYALLAASISSITASIPPELIVALVADGHWTAAEGLKHARLLPAAEAKAKALTGLLALPDDAAGAPAEAAVIAAEAADAARSIDEPGSRAAAFTALAARALEPDRKAAVTEAWEAVRGIRRERSRARAFVTLAGAVRLPNAVLDEARTLAGKCQDPVSKVLMLTTLVPQSREPGRGAALDGAWAAIGAISQPEDRATALIALFRTASAQVSAEKDVLEAIEMINSPEAAVARLIALIPRVRATRRPDLIGRAVELAGEIRQAEAKAAALIALVGLVPVDSESGELQEKAASAIREISQPAARAIRYTALATHQEAGFRSATLALALSEACAIDDAGARAAGLAALLPQLPWEDSPEAELDGCRAARQVIDEARASGRRTVNVITLAALAPALPEADRAAILKEASAGAYQVREPVDRAAVFTALLSSLAEPERAGAMEQACAAACAIPDIDLRRAALWSLAAAAPDALGLQAARAARWAETVVGRSAELNAAVAACGLGPEERQRIAPAILADPALALATDPPGILPPSTPAANRGAVRRSAADLITAIGALHSSATALAVMMAASAGPPPGNSGGPGTARAIARAWSAACQLSDPERRPALPGTLEDQLREALRSIEDARAWAAGDPPGSGPAGDGNSTPLAGPVPPWEPHWRAVMDAAVGGRTALISELSAMGVPIFHFGGSPAVRETVKALFDVGLWWP